MGSQHNSSATWGDCCNGCCTDELAMICRPLLLDKRTELRVRAVFWRISVHAAGAAPAAAPAVAAACSAVTAVAAA